MPSAASLVRAPHSMRAFRAEVSAVCAGANQSLLGLDMPSPTQARQAIDDQLALASAEARLLSPLQPPSRRAVYRRFIADLERHVSLLRQAAADLRRAAPSPGNPMGALIIALPLSSLDNTAANALATDAGTLGLSACVLRGTTLAPAAARNRTLPSGRWLATQSFGTGTLTSVWTFTRVCRSSSACEIEFTRQLPEGRTDEARLSMSIGASDETVFTATFPAITSGCLALAPRRLPDPGEHASMSDQYEILWSQSGGGLVANVTSTGSCPQPWDVIGGLAWKAARLPAATGTATHGNGAGRPAAPAPTGFAAREARICADGQRLAQALGSPDPSNPAPWIAKTYSVLSSIEGRLAALRPTPADADAYRTFLAQLRSQASLVRRFALATESGRSTLAGSLATQIAARGPALTADAYAAGFDCGEPSTGPDAPRAALPTCAAAGVDGGREAICADGGGMLGRPTTYNIVDAGHTLRMPAYELRLLATRITVIRVSNAGSDPTEYPHGAGLLVSLEISVTNTTSTPLAFDPTGKDDDLLIPNPPGPYPAIAIDEIINPYGTPGVPIADESPIAPHATVSGWLSFVAPSWAGSVLHTRGSDIEFYPHGDSNGDYEGELRLWKAATPQGLAALSLPPTARLPQSAPPSVTD